MWVRARATTCRGTHVNGAGLGPDVARLDGAEALTGIGFDPRRISKEDCRMNGDAPADQRRWPHTSRARTRIVIAYTTAFCGATQAGLFSNPRFRSDRSQGMKSPAAQARGGLSVEIICCRRESVRSRLVARRARKCIAARERNAFGVASASTPARNVTVAPFP